MEKIRLLLTLLFFLPACSQKVYNGKNDIGKVREIPAKAINPLETTGDLDILIEKIGDSRIVLLGEASHGTSEFYTWRAEISKRLISEKGFEIIAVEGDWADAYPVNEYTKGRNYYSTAREALNNFDRWPEWMWKNKEVDNFIEWLRSNNEGKSISEKTGFYGLDIYGIWESLEVIEKYLQKEDPDAAEIVNKVMKCFAPYDYDELAYGKATVTTSANCSEELKELMDIVEKVAYRNAHDEAAFNALQNAIVVINAENYYRIAVTNSSSSWNIRDEHMGTVLCNLLKHYGDNSKIIVWEHNTHIGDARATDMVDEGLVNVGQLVRERYGEDEVYIVGFGTYSGKVLAADQWGNKVKVMDVPAARKNSWEWILHRQGPEDKIIFLDYLKGNDLFSQRIGHRAIGVIFNPRAEARNYVPSVLPGRYDAFIFIDQTTALEPLR